ncbi:MAG: biopolymer transporter ExbD [Pseudomonadota bacterium]
MKPRRPSTKREPVISLINIVFLILIFFMVAGTLTGRNTSGVAFVQTSDLDCCVDADALVLTARGQALDETGAPISLIDHVGAMPEDAPTVRLMPDRDLPATDLIATISDLKRAGAGRIVVVTESAAP